MERVIKIWEERKLFEKEYFEVLCNKLGKFIYCWIVIKYLKYLIIFNMLMNVFICFNYIKMIVRYGLKDIRYEVFLFVK